MKVNVGNAKDMKHYEHDLSHDVSTSSDFGFMQPLTCLELIAPSKTTFRAGQLVRLQPMKAPVFGTMYAKTYNVFVPIESVYHPYGSLRAGQTYMGANATYIPDMVMSINLALLSYFCKCCSQLAILKLTNDTDLSVGQDAVTYSGGSFVSYSAGLSSEWVTVLSDWSQKCENYILGRNDTFGLSSALSSAALIPPAFDTSKLAGSVDLSGFDWNDVIVISGDTYIVCGKYTIFAKNLRKIFYGCGYKLLWDNELLTALPLFAYWKAYFDLFAPQRDITWKDTAGAGIQEWCEQYGRFNFLAANGVLKTSGMLAKFVEFMINLGCAYYTKSPDFVSSHITGQRISTVPLQNIQPYDPNGSTYVGLPSNNGQPIIGSAVSSNQVVSSTQVTTRLLNQSNLDLLQRLYHRINAHTQIGGRIREYLKSQLGVDYLDEDESYWIGADTLDISPEPIVATAQTSQAVLGQLGGQGSSGQAGQTFTFNAKVPGFWVSMFTIVPEARYCQGVDMNLKHIRKDDFYDPAYDSLTLLPTAKKFIFGENQLDNINSPVDYSAGFGNVPSYFEYTQHQNVINGDMSLKSTRATYLPWNLDILLPYTHNSKDENNLYHISSMKPSYLVNGTIWRYINRYQWLGNFNRIFFNSGNFEPYNVTSVTNNIFYSSGFDDNMEVSNVLTIKTWNSKLPCRNSFQTGAFDSEGFAIEKA